MFKIVGMTGVVLAALGCGGGGSSAPLMATNSAPSIPDVGMLWVQEGSTAVANIDATDSNGDDLTYRVSGGDDQSSFTVSPTGNLSFFRAPDFESPTDQDRDNTYALTVQVSDGNLSDTLELQVSIVDAFEGRIAVAPVAGAAVFVDMNGSGSQDEGEPSSVTNDQGFFHIGMFELPEQANVQVVAIGGTDITTGQLLPRLTYISPVMADKSLRVSVNALTTMLSAADGANAKEVLLAAMGIEGSPEETLTADDWQLSASGDLNVLSRHRVNRQLGLLQQTVSEIIHALDLTDQHVYSVRTVASQLYKAADSGVALDLTAAEFLEDVIRETLEAVSPGLGVNGETLAAISRSVAIVNAVIADPTLGPRSDVVADIARASQGTLLLAVSQLTQGMINIREFSRRTEPSVLFTDVRLPPGAADTDLDGIADPVDPDDDGDGVNDGRDRFSKDPSESQDSDADGIGNNADLDDDNDGVNDDLDFMPLDKNVHTMPTTAPQDLTLELLPQAQNVVAGRLFSTSQDSRPVTYSIVTQAAHGSVILTNAGAGTFEYSTTTDTGQNDSFSYAVNDGYVESAPSTVSLALLTDPLYEYQWHLTNTGQANFADTGGLIGADMNVSGAIAEGYTGKGVVLAVVDTGLEVGHEDLVDNVVPGSYDFVESDADPTRQGSGSDHGTAVAGIAAARGWNGIGPRGVAPKVSLKGYNWLMSQSTANWVSTFGGEAYSKDVDIFNNSWGSAARKIDDPLKQQEETTFNETLPAMRQGKGAIFVKSAGNYFNANANDVCGTTNRDGGLSCRDVNQDSTHNNPNIIVVSALNANGTRASYSTVGSAIWVSAPGGENGSSEVGGKPAIMTTDVQGCTKGYVGGHGDGLNAFNSKSSPHAENANCSYTSTMNGTSSAAPNVSGAIALMLEANPQLTMRDVKHILANTSQQVDPSIKPVLVDGIAYHEWVTNHVGYTYHNYYGFGGIDVTAAVNAAKSYTLNSLADRLTFDWISTGTIDLDVGFAATVTQTLSVPTSGTVEYVLVRLTLTHEDPSEVGFRLTSPSGTTTSIWQPYVAAATSVTSKAAYLSASAFYGESMAGDWTLSAYDHESGKPMTLHSYEIKIEYR